MPQVIRMDRDPRLVGSSSNDIFPSAFMRTLLCLGVSLDICPPQRPDRKPFVERFIRTQKEESIYPRRPATVQQSQLWLDEHRSFYNQERPNQAISCNNQPPSIAIGTPPSLRKLPLEVDVDGAIPGVFICVNHGPISLDAGDIRQDIDAAEGGCRLGGDALGVC